jgi:hypothetical protein
MYYAVRVAGSTVVSIVLPALITFAINAFIGGASVIMAHWFSVDHYMAIAPTNTTKIEEA